MERLLKAAACLVAVATIALASALDGTTPTPYRLQYPMMYPSSLGGMCTQLDTASPSNDELNQIAQAGFKFVRVDLTWQGIEQQQGVYNWTAYDLLMQQLVAHGLRAMFTLDYSNTLYSSTGAPNTPASRTGFANYAAAAVAHYIHQGVIWEIYNEPNVALFWPNPNPADYVALVNTAVPAMRAVSSDEWIVALETPPPSNGNYSTYIQQCFQDGLASSQIDAIALHAYVQGPPEGELAYWNQLSQWENQYSPAASVPFISSENGWSLMWSGIDTTAQAEYLVRYLMLDLVNGIGFSNVFSFRDLGTDTSNYHDWFGLESYGGATVRPSYTFIQQVAASLQGYTYNMRLSLPDPNDYCLLFTSGANVKLVAWTADPAHSVTLPSSPCTFSVVGFTTNTTVTSSGSGVTFTLTGEPCVFTAQSANPLLVAAALWAQLPSSITVASEADAINQLQAIVASPAWANVPSGATLAVSDSPNSAPMFIRKSFQTTLSNLVTLTPGSSGVQALFNSLPFIQDELNVPSTLSFTLQMPDGTSVSQSTQVGRKQPMSLDVTTPQGWSLTTRVNNPTGLPFSGSVTAVAGTKSVTQQVKFTSGQTSQMFFFQTLTNSMISSSAQVTLYDNSVNTLATTYPVVQTQVLGISRWSDITYSAGYSVSVNGSSSVAGSASLSYGTVPVSDNTPMAGGAMGIIKYSFGAGWKYAVLTPPSSLSGTTYSTQILGVGAWVKGDSSLNVLRTFLVDNTGQVFQATYGPITWTGWQWTVIPTTTWSAHWGGANDGVVHYPIRCSVPLLLDSNTAGSSGTIEVYGPTILRKSQ